MAYHRALGGDDNGVLCACSICGVAYSYPAEMRYCSDKKFRCLRTCNDPHLPEDELRKTGQGARTNGNESVPTFTVGTKPSYFP